MFSSFPKERPALPENIRKIYAEHYKKNREGESPAASLAQGMESWLHKCVAEDVNESLDKDTLELGAGTLNQLPYETQKGSYDIVEPFTSLFENSTLLSKVRNVYSDTSEIPDTERYDRIISIAVLEHIANLPEVVARCGLLLKEGGTFRASIPSEGTLLWYLGWRLTTGLEFAIKHRLDYGKLMRHEHVNKAKEIEEVLNYFFKTVDCKVFGLAKPLSLYQFFACSNPDRQRCESYLKGL